MWKLLLSFKDDTLCAVRMGGAHRNSALHHKTDGRLFARKTPSSEVRARVWYHTVIALLLAKVTTVNYLLLPLVLIRKSFLRKLVLRRVALVELNTTTVSTTIDLLVRASYLRN